MARSMIIASALTALLGVACTRAPSSAATPGDTAAPAASPSKQPGAPIPDQRNPQPAPDTAPPGPPAKPSTDSTPAGTPSSRASDSAHVAALEHAAVALAKTTGCSSDDQCRNVPIGAKACGGPRYYLKYCALSTDTVALFRAVARLDSAERAYNAKYHIVSTCQMILPTRPHLVGGACH